MADPKSPDHLASDKHQAESPTTARPIDFDDDQQETGVVSKDSSETPTKPPRGSSLRPERNVRFEEHDSSDETPPPKPPRPNSPNTEAVETLKEAFPDIDAKVIRAVLAASGGQVEPAFNALLGMSDPNFQEEVPPPQPPRPAQQRRQEEQDELFARQLAQQYGAQGQGAPHGGPRPEQVGRDGRPRLDEEDRDYSFFDDDLPEIKDQITKSFRDTQRTINKWVTNFRKTIDGEPESDEDDLAASSSRRPQRQNFGPKQSDQLRGIQKNAAQMQRSGRRSTDQERYDADPRVLSDNFNELELHDAEAEQPPPKPARPLANPDLFKPTPALPSGPVDEVEALYEQPPKDKTGAAARSASPNSQVGPNAAGTPASSKSKKWQPLTSIAPAPEQDADDDPFKLNSDDDEDDAAGATKTQEVRKEDTERLKAAAATTAPAKDGAAPAAEKSLQEHERSGSVGTLDKAAQDLLTKGAGEAEGGKDEETKKT